jgi:Na+/H+ antiporter NhaD/arsenite permease-like protein
MPNLYPMLILIVTIFVIGYVFIALEHTVNINKTASALLTGIFCWTFLIFATPSESLLSSDLFARTLQMLKVELGESAFNALTPLEQYREFALFELTQHLSSIAQIIFFLLGAMTIVELIDAHHGFQFITDRIKTKHPASLLWIVCLVTFFLSSILDNLTTAIVMVSLCRKLIQEKQMRMFFAGMIIIASNAGGAWTPIGDITTTMLWIGGRISTLGIMEILFLPSIICLLVPLIFLTFTMKGSVIPPERAKKSELVGGGKLMLFLGVGGLMSVPVFKTITHLPPYLGMLLALGIIWVVSELIHRDLDETERKKYTASGALSRVDVPSVLFFLGILLAVAALESAFLLQNFAQLLADVFGDNRIIITLIGVLSAVIDNVPLVAASMGMYSPEVYPMDHMIWEYLAYCAGTGGSMLIIGSAAGVAVMGMEKIDFMWYTRKISLIAALGYFSGAIVYLVLISLK